MDERTPWHQLFALSWMDLLRGTPVRVDPEKDLSHKKQLLDMLLRKEAGAVDRRLPDGFEELADYNLVTFKSYQEALSEWTLQELLGHFVNLRKQVSPSMDEDDLLPAEQFRLYAVSVRFPQQLANTVNLLSLAEGVYEVRAFSRGIRIIVANQLPREEHNAMLHLFSSRPDVLAYGMQHYAIRSRETSTLLLQLFQRHHQEGQIMPDMLEELYRETVDRLLKDLPAEKRLEGLSAEKRLEGLSAEKRLEGLTAEQRVEGLSAEQRVEGLSAETLQELADKRKGHGATDKPE